MTFFKFAMTSALIASLGIAQQAPVQQNEALKIVVVAGQGAINILDDNLAEQPIVEVRDKNDKPVVGARVTFVVPRTGPRAVFAGGKDSVSVMTASDGRGRPGEMRPIQVGAFSITVRVQYRSQGGFATIKQTNYLTRADAEPAGAAPARIAPAGALEANSFKIEILEGDDGVNIIDKDTAVKALVRIVDKNNLPGAGVAVAISIGVALGVSAEFQGGGKTATVVTDANGQATVEIVHPKGTGSFQIQIQATVQGQPLKTTVTQTNFKTERAALDAGKIPGTSKGDAPEAAGRPIQVKIVDGNGGANVVKNKVVAKQVVEVDDDSGAPVTGVKVAFVLPAKGASAVFADGKSYLIATTDATGRAEAGKMRPRGKGTFRISILAAYQGVSTSSIIQQTNFLTVAAARRAGKTPGSSEGDSTTANANTPSTSPGTGGAPGMSAATKALLAIGIVAGAAAGVAEAVGSKSSSTSSSGSSGPSCNASALRTQLQAAFQNACSSSNSIGSVWIQLCSCVGAPTPNVTLIAAETLDVCLQLEGVPPGNPMFTPAGAAASACP